MNHSHHSSRRLWVTLLVAAAIATTLGCGAEGEAAPNPSTARPAGSGGPGGPGGPGGGGGGPAGGGPSPVEIAVVERTSLARTSVVTGQLSAVRAVGVNSQVAGALIAVKVEEGSRVRRGQLLAEIDPRELTAQVRAAEASLAFARSTAERSQALFTAKVITQAEYDRDRTALASAEASLSQLQTRLELTRVTAPLTGVITQRFVREGDIVGGQTQLFTLADVSTLVTLLPVSELEVPLLKTGSQVPVSIDALGTSVTGTIRRIFPAADSANRLVPVEVAIAGDAVAGLRPGYTVRATLQLDERTGVLVVPTRAVVGAEGTYSVYLIANGRAERRRVRVGVDLDGRTEVIEGLAFGDTIITTGNAMLRDGTQVRVVQPLSPEGPAVTKPLPAPAKDAPAPAKQP
jgi:membrane fusion protein (multidrug efflux system)